MGYLERSVGAFQLVTLLHALGTAILGVTAILQGPPLLLESDDLLTRESVQFFVKFANGERDELIIVQQVVTPRTATVMMVVMMMMVMQIVTATTATRIRTQSDHHTGAATWSSHFRSGGRTGAG